MHKHKRSRAVESTSSFVQEIFRNIPCFLQWAHISNWYVSHVPYAVTYRVDGYGDVDELKKNLTDDDEVKTCSVIHVTIYHLPG